LARRTVTTRPSYGLPVRDPRRPLHDGAPILPKTAAGRQLRIMSESNYEDVLRRNSLTSQKRRNRCAKNTQNRCGYDSVISRSSKEDNATSIRARSSRKERRPLALIGLARFQFLLDRLLQRIHYVNDVILLFIIALSRSRCPFSRGFVRPLL